MGLYLIANKPLDFYTSIKNQTFSLILSSYQTIRLTRVQHVLEKPK